MEKRIILPLVLIFLGLFVPYWFLALCGVMLFVLWGKWFAALCAAMVLDVAFGPVVGAFHLFVLPFTFFTALFVLVRLSISPYIRQGLPHRI